MGFKPGGREGWTCRERFGAAPAGEKTAAGGEPEAAPGERTEGGDRPSGELQPHSWLGAPRSPGKPSSLHTPGAGLQFAPVPLRGSSFEGRAGEIPPNPAAPGRGSPLPASHRVGWGDSFSFKLEKTREGIAGTQVGGAREVRHLSTLGFHVGESGLFCLEKRDRSSGWAR